LNGKVWRRKEAWIRGTIYSSGGTAALLVLLAGATPARLIAADLRRAHARSAALRATPQSNDLGSEHLHDGGPLREALAMVRVPVLERSPESLQQRTVAVVLELDLLGPRPGHADAADGPRVARSAIREPDDGFAAAQSGATQ
jgi:hypothetical protein